MELYHLAKVTDLKRQTLGVDLASQPQPLWVAGPVAAQIPTEHKSATEAATMYHDAISRATD